MKSIQNLFDDIKKSFTLRKKIEIEGVVIEMEPLTTLEEIKIIEACKDLEGGAYIESLKKNSLAFAIKKVDDVSFEDEYIEFENDDGTKDSQTKYLFLLKQVEGWPSVVRDVLFDAFNDMQLELENRVTSKTKFERFSTQEQTDLKPEETPTAPPGFTRVEEPKEEPADEIEKLNKQVKEELDKAQTAIVSADTEAERKG